MRHIQGSDRAQSLLLPASVEDYVGADNPVRAIEAFVDGFDLAKAGFVRAEAKETGRPGYHPGDLPKLYLYGYLNRVRSSRRLEAECHRNLEVIWLLRGLRPDFKTIADFRRENVPAFKAAFRRFVYLCRQLDLFGKELLAMDGTRLKAVNSTERNFTWEKLKTMLKNADARLAEYLAELAKADDQEGGPPAGSVTGQEPGREDRHLAEATLRLCRHRGGAGAHGREPGVAHRPGQPRHGHLPQGGRRLQRAGGGGRQAQVDRRAGSHQPGQRLRAARSHGDSRPRKLSAWTPSRPRRTGDTTRARTSRRAKPQASWLSCPNRSEEEPPPATTVSPRRRFSTTPSKMCTVAPTARPCPPMAIRPRVATGCSSTTIRPRADVARYGRSAPPTNDGGASPAGKTRRCSTRWRRGWPPTRK